MASNADTKEKKPMASDLVAGGADGPRDERPPDRPVPARGSAGPGFFSIYKKGQGYWTRMGTAIGAGLIGTLITWQIAAQVPAFFADTERGRRVGLIAAAI